MMPIIDERKLAQVERPQVDHSVVRTWTWITACPLVGCPLTVVCRSEAASLQALADHLTWHVLEQPEAA